MRITCPNCGGAHPAWDCKRPATKSSPGDNSTLPYRKVGIADGGIRVGQSDADAASLVVRKEPSEKRGVATQRVEAPQSIAKRPRGRPRIHPDRKAYKAQWERDKRKRMKEGK